MKNNTLEIEKINNPLPALLRDVGYLLEFNSCENYFSGREKELLKMQIAFNKKIKNNIMLVGSPGVGKTCLVREFARKNKINNMFVVECAKLLGNTEYRGTFEQKVIDLMDYAKNNSLVIFFDEIHILLDLGKTTGGISITDILKPHLLDSDLIFIGATTLKEVKYFVNDEAFKRRFTIIKLEEPSVEILKKIKQSFENNVLHKTIITENFTEELIKMLSNKLPEEFFPDKLIDFLDYAYAFSNVTKQTPNIKFLLKDYIHDRKAASFYA